MKCYRIRKKTEYITPTERGFMERRGETECFASPLYDTLKGARSALNNSNGYLSQYKHMFDIVEYTLTESQVF